MISPELLRYLNYQQYNIMPYGGAFFCGCCVLMLLMVEIAESWFGIPWARFVLLVGLALLLFSVLPLSSYKL